MSLARSHSTQQRQPEVLALRLTAEEAEAVSDLLFAAVTDCHEDRMQRRKYRAFFDAVKYANWDEHYKEKARILDGVMERLWDLIEGPHKLN